MVGIVVGERRKAYTWSTISVFIGVGVFLFTLPFTLPANVLRTYGLGADSWEWVWNYFKTLFIYPAYWADQYRRWVQGSAFIPMEFFVGFGIGLLTALLRIAANPYDFNKDMEGAGRIAKDRDVEATGLMDGIMIVLGKWKGKFLMLPETLSVLCVAPPGTGKTTGIVVPTILKTHNTSMVINDVKPELFDLTSGYKSQDAVCLRLEWSAKDRPEDGIFFPRWNPLSPLSMPPSGANRDLYIDRLVTVLIPEAKGNADPHWSLKARSALAGMIHFITSKVEAGNYDNIPKQWFGHEQSLPMLLDWFTEAQLNSADEIENLRQTDPNAALFADPVKNFLVAAVKESRKYHYNPRAGLELTQLANTPDKERGSILSTMDAGLTVFKNAAVRARTSKSDFAFSDLRGIKDPKTGEVKPLLVYICVNQEDSRSLSVITGLFVEALSAWLVAHKPGSTARDGSTVGPYPTLFVLDEFPQMPKLDALINGPAVGRGQKVSYLMIGQDLGQISAVYGKDNLETIFSTTAAKVVLPLNNEQTADRFSKMIGKFTMNVPGYSWEEGIGVSVTPFKKTRSTRDISESVVLPFEFMSLPKGKHFVLYQRHMHKPILSETPYFFKDAGMKALVNPENGGKFKPAAPMPEWMIENRIREERAMAGLTQLKDAPAPDSAGAEAFPSVINKDT